ncbi:MAG: HDOD domain-containing protein [Planctomycetaceae bacterium]
MNRISLERVLSSDQLPTLPEVAVRVIQIAKQSEPDMQELIDTIRADGAIAGRILKFANSALFGVRRKPSSIEAAVPLLGTTMVQTLVLGFSLAQLESQTDDLRPWFQKIWRESLLQASTAETLAERIPTLDAPTWFLAGLLQDIGRLALLATCGQSYVDSVLDVRDDRTTFQREQEALGYTHVDVSVGLCRKWSLDPTIVESIAVHHRSIEDVLPNTEHSRSSLAAALIASRCCSDYMEEVVRNVKCARQGLEKLLILDFGLRPDEVFRLLADVDCRVSELASGFSIDVGRVPSREAILARAQAALVEIAMRSHLSRVTSGRMTEVREALVSETSDDDEQDVDYSQWLDESTGTYSPDYLQKALPAELSRNHADNTSTGFLCVTLPNTVDHRSELLCDVAETIRENVRPADSIVRNSPGQLLVLLTGLNIDVLSKIAERIHSELHGRSIGGLPKGDADVRIAGLLHIPSGRKPIDAKLVRRQLEEPQASAKSDTAGTVSMKLMHGCKVREVTVAASPSNV